MDTPLTSEGWGDIMFLSYIFFPANCLGKKAVVSGTLREVWVTG